MSPAADPHPRALHAFRRPQLWLGIWIAALAATLVLCLLPMPALDLQVDDADKALHALGHAALAAYALMLYARPAAVMRAIVGLVALGVAIELLQTLLPWRSGGDPIDMLANALGTALGSAIGITPLRRGLLWVDALAFGAASNARSR